MTKVLVEPAASVNEVNRISSGTIVKGELYSEGDIRIDGKVDGKVYSKGKIVVGEKATMKGSLMCGVTDFWGKMDGDIYVKDMLSLKSTSEINGSIQTRRFEVEVGAKINGTCKMISEAEYDKIIEGVKGKTEVPVSKKA